MRFKFLSLFVVLLCYACENAPEGKKVAEVVEQKPLQLKQENIELYQLKQDSLIDSLLLPIEEFTAFSQSMEDLTKLKPGGIAPFLLGAIIKCNALLRYQIPAPFDTPEIKSRLKVVKTALLKARYYSVEERQQELDESYEALFIAYTAYLKRIEDFSLDLQEEQELNDVIDLNQ